MKTITKFVLLVSPAILMGAFSAKAQCVAGYTWTQPSSNVLDFTNTSMPITANSTNFYWNFGDFQGSNLQNPSHTYSVPGTYAVCLTMYDSLSNCQAAFCDSVTVTGSLLCNMSANISVLYNPSCSVCADGALYISASGATWPLTYAWSNGPTTAGNFGLNPGYYYCEVTDANGCMAADSVVLDTASNCSITFNTYQSPNGVTYFTSTVNSPSTSNVVWDFGDNSGYGYGLSTAHSYTQTGTYMVCALLTDSVNQCTSSFCDSVTVTTTQSNALCDANFAIYPDSANGNLAWVINMSTGGPNMMYYWSWGDNTSDTGAYPSHTYTNTGSYIICLTIHDLSNQCSDSACLPLMVARLSQQAASVPYYVNVIGPTGIQEQQQSNWSLYPNPASTEVRIKSDYTLQGKQYRILDIAGRMVDQSTLSGSSINISALEQGMYILQIENTKGGFTAQRFMKD